MKYFNIAEMCVSGSHPLLVEKPKPGTYVYNNLVKLIETTLDPIREKIGQPIRVTSGYRCPKLNAAVGGSKTSNHLEGCAADCHTGNKNSDNLKIVDALLELGIDYDECIVEGAKFNSFGKLIGCQWIHLATKSVGNRKKFIYTTDFKTYHLLKRTEITNYEYSR